MFTFEGNYKSRRSINLGNKKSQENKDSVVKDARDRRKERENERSRQKSAAKIQAFYYGRIEARKLRSQLRENWDNQSKIILQNVKNKREMALSLITFVRKFLFFYQLHHDNDRKKLLSNILLQKSFDSYILFVPFVFNDLYETWTYQLKKTLLIFVKSIGSNEIKTVRDILVYLVKNGMFREFREILLHLPIEDKKNQLIFSILFSILPLFNKNDKNGDFNMILENFILQIFTIPNLPNRINVEDLKLGDILKSLNSMDFDVLSLEQKIELMSSLVAFVSGKLNQSNNYFQMEDYLGVIQRLSLQIPTSLIEEKSNTFAADIDEEDDEYNLKIQEKSELLIIQKIDSLTKKRISMLFDTQNWISIFVYGKTGGYVALRKIALLMMTLLIRWPSRKMELLDGIIYNIISISKDTPTISILWLTLKELGFIPKTLLNKHYYMDEPLLGEDWAIFALICEIYSRGLYTMGDNEFFDESKNPLSLSEILELSTTLKNIGFSLYWNSSTLKMDNYIEGSCISFNYLRDIVTRLLQQIHAKDSRRSFTPPNHWLMSPEFDVIADKKLLTSISPKLGILNNIPFVIPFEDRVKIFRQFIQNDLRRRHNYFGRTFVTIHRTNVFEDGFKQLNDLGPNLKKPIAIKFIDEFGIQEAGIDGGGLFKEFLTSITHIAFDTNYGLFLNTKEQLLYPNPHLYARQETQLNYYGFIGRILGKALYEGILVDAAFAGFFLSKWLGRSSYLDDLPSLDPELYQGLMFLKNYKGDVESDLSLNFTVVDDEFGETRTIELVPGGSNIPVTNNNSIEYIYRVANHRLNAQIYRQCKAFFNGLSDLIEPKWLRMFNQQELQILVGGAYIPIDIEDLRQNTVYADYKEDDPVMINFWQVVSDFSEEQKQKLIKFVTSCSRPPLLGFKELHPKFSIRRAGTEIRLPSSSTCVNLLKLPAYPDKKILKEKLEYAINADVGFDLS
nr:680_t:CDS:10 [Entrophospora candida]CAG8546331.1 11073_t:CDS:10 [Entrophospora candida]